MRTLVQLWYSPWSERARWALDHHGIPYKKLEYVPMLGEPLLRLRTGKYRGNISVPVLFDTGEMFGEGIAIAKHAERIGTGKKLFHDIDDVMRWNAIADRILDGGRALLLPRMVHDEDALLEAMPSFIPAALRRASLPVAAMGTRHVEKKWVNQGDRERLRRQVVEGLDALREGLSGGKKYLAGELSYADITMAVALQGIVPVAEKHIPLKPATRRIWTDTELAEKYPDLMAWRDALYDQHRQPTR